MKKLIVILLSIIPLLAFAENAPFRNVREFNVTTDFKMATFDGNHNESEMIERNGEQWGVLWNVKKQELLESLMAGLNETLNVLTYAHCVMGAESYYFSLDFYITDIDPDGEVDAILRISNSDGVSLEKYHTTINANGGKSNNYLTLSPKGFKKLGTKAAYYLSDHIQMRR